MNGYTLYKLTFPHGLHVGSTGFGEEIGDEIIHSDTLFSAIASAAFLLYGSTVGEQFLRSDSMTLSSAFPYFRDELFFPKPLSFRLQSLLSYSEGKKFKKMKYVGWEYLKQILVNGEISGNSGPNEMVQSCWGTSLKHLEGDNIFKFREIPRVTIDRVSNASTLFHFSELFFHRDAGLWFLASFADESMKKIFNASLGLLSDEGIGADRTIGKGWFVFQENAFPEVIDTATGSRLLLSLYTPDKEEMKSLDAKRSYYDLTSRRGWVNTFETAGMRRRCVRAFSEGSVLTFSDKRKPKGVSIDALTPEDANISQTIVRNMRAFTLPITIPETT